MKVLILSPYPQEIFKTLKKSNEKFIVSSHKLDMWFLNKHKIVLIISFGYKYIILKNIIDIFKNKIINLHISYLPFNKGYYPNLWSHLEGSPSGISIHKIDKGIDTGAVLVQRKIFFNIYKHSFKTSYEILKRELIDLFCENCNLLKGN